jgi:hypothetical protein
MIWTNEFGDPVTEQGRIAFIGQGIANDLFDKMHTLR